MEKHNSRRSFIRKSVQNTLGLSIMPIVIGACQNSTKTVETILKKPLIISTWNNKAANQAAWNAMQASGNSLDAVEAGARVPEADVNDQSVGFGGRPDRDGNVTLDACIMDSNGGYGAVTYLQHIKHPVSVARMVMEKTPHVMLSGEGALKFALENGFTKEDLLTEKSRKDWEEWLKTSVYKPKVNIELHDTIGILAIDQESNLAGACTTSGLAYKMQGRIGDSPVVGAGLFVDNEVGAATATGMGELVLKSVGSFLIVELMRQGMSPAEACKEAVMRIVRKQNYKELQVGYIAINKDGIIGAYSLQSGFVYTVTTNDGTALKEVVSYIDS